MTARRTALICALVNSAVAVQNPFGFLKTGPHAAHQVAIAEESTADSKIDSLATTSRNAAKHARNKHGETHASMKNHARDADEEAEIMAIQKKKEELTNRVAETHDSANQEHAELGAPCSGDPIVCKTMCRWLKMSNKDTNENCKLFEWQLRSCNYTAIEERPAGSSTDPMDCAVNFLRTAVLEEEVPGYVSALDTCTEGLPPTVNETCYVALGLLRGEVHDWKAENELRLDAAALGKDLRAAAAQGSSALQSKKKEQEAIDALTEVLARAEELPGHYLVDEVAKARSILDTLGPIPAVRKELAAAMSDATMAFKTTDLFKVKESYVWLGVSVTKGEKYKIGVPLPEAQAMLLRIAKLKDALLDLQMALFASNVSVATKSSVHETRLMLDAAIKRAQNAGLDNEMPISHELLHKLEAFDVAIQNVSSAHVKGEAALASEGNKGIQSLNQTIDFLNTTIGVAQALGLQDNQTVGEAVGSLDNLLYIRHARMALNDAVESGHNVLKFNGGNISDDLEEIAIDNLEPAAAWADEVGLNNGIHVAESTSRLLNLVEEAKQNMSLALQIGNHSLEAKSGIANAISVLESAITGSMAVNVSAGVHTAQKELKLLRALVGARAACLAAAQAANASLLQRTGYQEAMVALNKSSSNAAKVGLKPESEIGEDQLQMLKLFADADHALTVAASKMAPARPVPVAKPLNDTRPVTKFKRTGLKPESLPDVPGAADDEDRDFREHERVLAAAIAAAKRRGLVDSDKQAQLATEVGMRRAFAMLQKASAMAAASLDKKTNIDAAITTLSSAIEECKETNMYIGLPEAQKQLDQLLIIQPARDELVAAMLQANVSMHTVSGLDAAIVRLQAAMDLNRQLEMFAQMPKATKLKDDILFVKNVYVALKAAILQGQIAMKNEEGEEAAISELDGAIEAADGINLHKSVKLGTDVLHQLVHLNAQHQQMQAAMTG